MKNAGLDEARYQAGWESLELTEKPWKAAYVIGLNVEKIIADGINIFASGPTGRGKTHACVLIAREAVSKGKSVAKVVWADFLDSIRDTYNKKSFTEEVLTERQQIQRLIDADLCFLDDVGSAGTDGENGSKFSQSRLERIIIGRYDLGKPTMLTCNFNLRDIQQITGDRVADRIKGKLIELAFTGKEYRKITESVEARKTVGAIWQKVSQIPDRLDIFETANSRAA
jgi:DNA replication protein DnaC